jgi:alkanesulfonate monooxygenase SsuD/methylene tetrahydromethanopterin reductase-like flavin-dependent oxidoreductase (luciferase family)
MTVQLGAFVVPDASDPDAVVEQVLAVERSGLELVGIQDHPYQRRFFDTFSLLAFLPPAPSGRRCSRTSRTCRCATRR